jgi:hypothetical protein
MKVLRSLVLALLGLSMIAGTCQLLPNVYAADLFSKIQCGSDIPKALIEGMQCPRSGIITADGGK